MVDFNWDDAKSGATVGAVAGTAVEPGVGTAVGAVGGGLIGGFGGFGGGLWNNMSGQSNVDRRYGADVPDRAAETSNINTLEGWANAGQKDQYGNLVHPNVPSAAQDLLNRNQSAGQQRAESNAKALAGGNTALAATLANKQQQGVAADSAFQAATLRSQEQQNAMQAYQAALERRRQQDLEQSQQLAQFDQENAKRNSSFIGGLLGGVGNIGGGMLGG